MKTAGSTFATLMLVAQTTPPGLVESLSQVIQPAITAYSIDQARSLLAAHRIDAIMVMDDAEPVLAFLKTLHKQRIVRAIITENFDYPGFAEVADVVCPPHPRYAYHQIRRALQQQTEKNRLRAEVDSLTLENETLQAQMHSQKKIISELEVLKTAIIRNVSHELRTPLLQVKSAVALMAEDADNGKLVGYAMDATARLEAVVTNITQLATSLNDLNISMILARECVDYALRNLRRAWEHKGSINRVTLCIDQALPPVRGDRQGISTVIQQLLDNALKFSEGTVEVIMTAKAGRVWITIKDYGIGISEEQQKAIFDAFYQVDSSSTRHYSGVGVGLAIVQIILDRHGESIRLESAPDQGSAFTFSLPIADIHSE